MIVSQAIYNGADFAAIVCGSSMEPTIHDGDTAFFRKQESAANGDIAAVCVGDRWTLKRFFLNHDGSVDLIGDNPAFGKISYTAQEVNALPVYVFGVFVGCTRAHDQSAAARAHGGHD